MSSSAINSQLFQAKAGSIQNQADSSSIYSAGVWSFKNSTAVASVTITDAGNVGVGISSPSSYGHGGTNKFIQVQNSNTAANSQAHLMLSSGYDTAGVTSIGSITWALPGVSSADKNVGFLGCSTTGTHTLAVPKTSLMFSTRNGASNIVRATIDADGNLFVGYSTGGAAAADGIVKAKGYNCKQGQNGGLEGNIFNYHWTGALQAWIDATNVGNVTLTSDYRIKKNIETQELPALERIAQLRPVKYELADYKELFKADGVQREGFIAHELQAVIPSAVEGEKDAEDQIQSLKLDALCSVMVKAIQEQQAQIESLKAEVAALKAP